MIRQMLEVSGAFPKKLATSGEFAAKHFNSEGEYLLKDPDSITGIRDIIPMKKYEKPRQPVSGMLDKVFKNPPPNSDPKTQERLMPRLADLVQNLLKLVPGDAQLRIDVLQRQLWLIPYSRRTNEAMLPQELAESEWSCRSACCCSRSPVLGRRAVADQAASQMQPNGSMTSLLAPWTGGLFEGWSTAEPAESTNPTESRSLTGWFSYEPPLRTSAKEEGQIQEAEVQTIPSKSPLCTTAPLPSERPRAPELSPTSSRPMDLTYCPRQAASLSPGLQRLG
eukprot:g33098.t1